MEHKITPRRTYFLVYIALMALLAATLFLAFVDLGRLGLVAALGIAIIKALLVILFFMHVRYSDRLTRAFVITGVIGLMHMVFMTLIDYFTRLFTGVLGR